MRADSTAKDDEDKKKSTKKGRKKGQKGRKKGQKTDEEGEGSLPVPFVKHHHSVKKPQTPSVSRRNARERNRVKQVRHKSYRVESGV